MAWTIHKNNAKASSSSIIMKSPRNVSASMTSHNHALLRHPRQSCHHQYHSQYDKDQKDDDDDDDDDASLTVYSTSSSDDDEYYEYSDDDDDEDDDENDLLDLEEDEDSSIQGLSIFAAEETLIHSQKRHVTFGTIQIRYYACTVGDHPLCQDSCPLTLDWKYYDDHKDETENESPSTSSCNTLAASTSPCLIPMHSFSVDSPSHNPHHHHRHARGWVPQLSYEQRRARVLHHLTVGADHPNQRLWRTHNHESPSCPLSYQSTPEVQLQQMEQNLIQKRLKEYIQESPHARTYLQRILHSVPLPTSTTMLVNNKNGNHMRVDDNPFPGSTTHPEGWCCRGQRLLLVAPSSQPDDRLWTQHADSHVPMAVALPIR